MNEIGHARARAITSLFSIEEIAQLVRHPARRDKAIACYTVYPVGCPYQGAQRIIDDA